MNQFLGKHGLTRGGAVKKILTNNTMPSNKKVRAILNSGKEGWIGAGYLKNVNWAPIVENLNSVEGLTNAQKKVLRNAYAMSSTHKVTGWTSKRVGNTLRVASKVGAVLGSGVLLARERLPNNQKRTLYQFLNKKFGPSAAGIARKILNKGTNRQEASIAVKNAPPEILTIIQNFTEMTPNQQLALENTMTRARSGNSNAQKRVNNIRNLAKFQSSVAASSTGAALLAGSGAVGAVSRVAAARNAAAKAGRLAARTGAPNRIRTNMLSQAARAVAKNQGMSFGQGVNALRRMTNSTRAGLNRARMARMRR